MNNQLIQPSEIINQLEEFALNHAKFGNYYASIDKLNIGSLQEVVCEKDREYLRKISTMLHIIMSIMSHPHIDNRREEVVTRIEQAKQLSNEDFSRVLKDGSLWRRHDVKLIPENVYYHQNVDELLIYENRFICLVLDLIEKDINDYVNLYVKMLPSLKNGILPRLDGSRPKRLLTYAELLKRKVNYLKNTHFYKEVSKAKKITGAVTRTNILLKDNLYGRVYRFYKEELLSEEKTVSIALLRDYFRALSLKEISARGFKLKKQTKEAKIFENDVFLLSMSDEEGTRETKFTVTLKQQGIVSKHLLILSLSSSFSDVEKVPDGYDGVSVLSCFGYAHFDKKAGSYDRIYPETAIVKSYFDEIVGLVESDREVYARYCPVCRERSPVFHEDTYLCPRCGSRYAFCKSGDADAVWFIRLRRS